MLTWNLTVKVKRTRREAHSEGGVPPLAVSGRYSLEGKNRVPGNLLRVTTMVTRVLAEASYRAQGPWAGCLLATLTEYIDQAESARRTAGPEAEPAGYSTYERRLIAELLRLRD